MTKTFNFYCDESCHLENDHQRFMVIGYVSAAFNQVKMHSRNIRAIKIKHGLKTELKWSALSKSGIALYEEVIDYFFATDLQYRAIVIDKSQLTHGEFNQQHDDFYYKMYYQLLNRKIDSACNYNIYLDMKDSRSAKKIHGLRNFLNAQYMVVRTLQHIRSHESELLQVCDIITGALSYHARGLNKVIAKNRIIHRIQQHSREPLNRSTALEQEKLNLFFIDLR
ncbi:MAG: DUF3800 domain-containing protein [Chitinophagaceae bacterium]